MNRAVAIVLRAGIALLLLASVPAPCFEISISVNDLWTTETTTREVGAITVTFPVDEADVVELLAGRLQKGVAALNREANREADAVVEELTREGPQGDAILERVSRALGPEVAPTAEEVAGVLAAAGSPPSLWRAWAGSIREARIWNWGTSKPYHDEDKHWVFEDVAFYFRPEGFLLQPVPPFIKHEFGVFRLARNASHPLILELAIMHRPGTQASEVANHLATMLETYQSSLREMAAGHLAEWTAEFLIGELVDREIEQRLKALDPPSWLTQALRRVLLCSRLDRDDEKAVRNAFAQEFHIELPKEDGAAGRLIRHLNRFDAKGDSSARFVDETARLAGVALLHAWYETSREKSPLELLERAGRNAAVWQNSGTAAWAAALDAALPSWRNDLANARNANVNRLRAGRTQRLAAAAAGEVKEDEVEDSHAFPPQYVELAFDGLTFHCPPDLAEAVRLIGPRWARQLPRARRILQRRLEAEPAPPPLLGEEDVASLEKYGIRPQDDELQAMERFVSFMGREAWAIAQLAASETVAIWFPDDLRGIIGDKGRHGGFEFDLANRTTGLWWSLKSGDSKDADRQTELELSTQALILAAVLEPDAVKKLSQAEQAELLEEKVAFLPDILRNPREADFTTLFGGDAPLGQLELARGDPFKFFVVVHELVEGSLVREVIASTDRRWFCDGMANLIAILECDRRFGAGTGMHVLDTGYDPEESRQVAKRMDLLAWEAVEDEDEAEEDEELTNAMYRYATMVMLAAVEGQGPDFIRRWLEEIQRTPWNRTNTETVMAAYEKLTGEPLLPILKRVVETQ